ncbi:MAG: transcription antitermination factor NusB [Acidobacteriota bacterium]|nr:transcription antitermination factor NusB [Acidobacteriota bacterium]
MTDEVRGRPERTRAREAALQLLYRAEVGKLDATAATADYWSEAGEYLEGAAEFSVREFAEALFTGVREKEKALDELISSCLQNWRLERVATVDRLVLRIAALELLRGSEPPAVIIDEAIELARRFGGDDSARFVNGVIDGIKRKLAE